MARLILVRHGQTNWNIEGKWQGHSDIPLNDVGKQQAVDAANELREEKIDHIYSSDLKRALDTAEQINTYHGRTIIQDARLREQNLGRWEGIFHKDIENIFPDEWASFMSDPASTEIVGGESVGQLSARVTEAINEIARRHTDENVMIVAHGLALAVFLCHVQNESIEKAYTKVPENAKPFLLDWNG